MVVVQRFDGRDSMFVCLGQNSYSLNSNELIDRLVVRSRRTPQLSHVNLQRNQLNQTPHYLVVGAGLAGLSCAQGLRAAGFDITVVDKSRGPSGRMSTRRGEDWACDHGAQYFTARSSAFQMDIARWQDAGVAALWTPRLQVRDENGWREGGETISRFVGVPRMTAPARLLADGLKLQTSTTVTALHRVGCSWQVETAEHGRLATGFDGVVLAVPAPQALPLLTPVSPMLAAQAREARMQGCWALMLRFDAALDLPFDAAFINHGPLRWVARDSSKPGRAGPETWSLHASTPWSEAHIEDDAETVASALVEAFIELGGRAPQAWTAHRWRYAITESATADGCAWDALQGLGLCGDWLNGGRVEGAWLSGRALAQRVRQSFVAEAC